MVLEPGREEKMTFHNQQSPVMFIPSMLQVGIALGPGREENNNDIHVCYRAGGDGAGAGRGGE
jgi:hypothetical protein